MINLKELIQHPDQLNEQTLPQLREMVDRYPFFQTARILYVTNLFMLHDNDFGRELRKASVFIPDRTALFLLTEGTNYQLEYAGGKSDIETESDANRTISLIDTFLSKQKQHKEEGNQPSASAQPSNMPSIADLTTDYASFLIQNDDEAEEEDTDADATPLLKGADLIDSFIAETTGKQRFEIADLPVEQEFVSPQLSDEDEEIYTESMVNIYIKQGRYQQALEILRKICLNNPKKSANFAAQIQLLEVITSQ